MTEFNLTQALYNIVSDNFKEAILESLKEVNPRTNAELLLALLKVVTNQVNIYERTIQKDNHKKTIYVMSSYKGNVIEEAQKQQLLIYSTQLIYLIRQFIHGEEITFHYGITNGKTKKSAFIPQEQVLANLSIVNKKAIGLQKSIQSELIDSFKNTSHLMQKRKNQWNYVAELAEAVYHTGKSIDAIEMHKHDKIAHMAYQSQKMDNMIYIYFTGRTYERYYNIDGGSTASSLIYFNNGHLWEWYNSILYGESDENYFNMVDSLQQHSLHYIFETKQKDNIPGTKQGDFKNAQNQWIQSKYNNTKIISLHNIKKILFEFTQVLTSYVKDNQDPLITYRTLAILDKHLFPEGAELGNQYAHETAEKLLSKLNAKADYNLTI